MSGPLKSGGAQMTITVQGHEVTLYFSSEPNSQVVSQVKQALLGTYLLKENPKGFLTISL